MRNKDLLIATQDSVWKSGLYQPQETEGQETTFCNMAVNTVLKEMGCTLLDGMSADEMVDFMRHSKDFLIKPIGDCQFLVNEGSVIVAGLKGVDLGQDHGHVCTLTPGAEVFSGHWQKKTPVCMNLGRAGTCSRSGGVNYAFKIQPNFFAWLPSL